MKKLISIVIPILNEEKYLDDCVNSVVNQSYSFLEIILIDDGSTDTSGIICTEWEKKDPRIIFIRQKHLGVSVARNTGMDKASGDYVVFVDADDILLPKTVELLFQIITDEKVDAVFSNYAFLYKHNTVNRKPRLSAGKKEINQIKHYMIDDGTLSGITISNVWNAIYKRSIIEKNHIRFDETLSVNEDGVFNMEYLLKSSTFFYSDQVTYHHRRYKSDKNNSVQDNQIMVEKATKKLKEIGRENNLPQLGLQLFNRQCFEMFSLSVGIASRHNKGYRSELKKLWETSLEYQKLDCKSLNVYKRLLWWMITHKCALLFGIMIRYVYPVLQEIVKR